MGKIVTKEEFRLNIRPVLKQQKKSIALCHGVFDLIHPGHITHFVQAKEMADVLVVSITAAKFVRKGPGRPYFNDEQRMTFLSRIDCIDYVLLSEGYTVDDIVECVEPDLYVKGSEYANESADITENIRPERELVEAHGGKLAFTTGDVFSSTKLINSAMEGLSKDVIEYMQGIKNTYSMNDLMKYANKAKTLKVLVLGDVIIDRYTFCNVQGLMSKNMAYSAREINTEDYLGGSVAVARHLAEFCDDVTLLSVIGDELWVEELLDGNSISFNTELIKSSEFPTIVKHRYLSPNEKRSEYAKVFVINNIPKNPKVDKGSLGRLKKNLKETIRDYDAVFVCDFGHGLIDKEIIDIVQSESKYLVLNCQTNSSNMGMNLITKYSKADVCSLDQKELNLAFPELAYDEEKAVMELKKRLNAQCIWLTRGAEGAWGVIDNYIDKCPAFTLKVSDTIGAGDAFYSAAGLFAASGAPEQISTMMGNVAGALGANIVGNKKAVAKVDALKFASTLMNV